MLRLGKGNIQKLQFLGGLIDKNILRVCVKIVNWEVITTQLLKCDHDMLDNKQKIPLRNFLFQPLIYRNPDRACILHQIFLFQLRFEEAPQIDPGKAVQFPCVNSFVGRSFHFDQQAIFFCFGRDLHLHTVLWINDRGDLQTPETLRRTSASTQKVGKSLAYQGFSRLRPFV